MELTAVATDPAQYQIARARNQGGLGGVIAIAEDAGEQVKPISLGSQQIEGTLCVKTEDGGSRGRIRTCDLAVNSRAA